ADGIRAAAAAVAAGQCIVLPTDTVYGIGADATSPQAVQALLDAKQRGRDMPPPILLPDAGLLPQVAADVPEAAQALAEAFWPGALTLILKALLPLDLGDRPETIAVRVPDHDSTRNLLRATGLLAVSSANVSGKPPATTVAEAHAMLGDSVAVYLDGGPTAGDMPSTIVDLASNPACGRIVRQGVISAQAIREVWPTIDDGGASA
ncbi:MAG: L-threonylcarbamoyladenylate synthase, partial [Propionibacteriaceae bacterium]|nr:L-threonylcarbamoyladenylate synthase [Propionibacteriaceae bacterium]